MIISTNKTIGTICHMCGYISADEISPFHIMDNYELKCRICGAKIIKIKKEKISKSYTLHQKCFLCGENHVSRISHKAMWNQKLFSFGCEVSLYDMCYVGEENEVTSSLNELMSTLNEISDETEPSGEEISDALTEAGYMMAAFELLKKFLADGKIRCICDDNRFVVRMTDNGIGIFCGNCGSFHEIKCKTSEDVKNFEKTDILLLRND